MNLILSGFGIIARHHAWFEKHYGNRSIHHGRLFFGPSQMTWEDCAVVHGDSIDVQGGTTVINITDEEDCTTASTCKVFLGCLTTHSPIRARA